MSAWRPSEGLVYIHAERGIIKHAGGWEQAFAGLVGSARGTVSIDVSSQIPSQVSVSFFLDLVQGPGVNCNGPGST